MSATARVAAVDLGASSGRVMVGHVSRDRLDLVEVNRFPNEPITSDGTLQWDIRRLYAGALDGLRGAGRGGARLDGVGIDAWAVDYGLLDADGRLLGNPVHYRDGRTDGVMAKVLGDIPPEELYAVTGLQLLPFNTIYQLVAEQGSVRASAARTMLLIPDLLAYWLTGGKGAELTNASTTQLVDATRHTWVDDLVHRLGLNRSWLPELRQPGERIGELTSEVLAGTRLSGPVPVIAVGSHDTASAVVGVPAEGSRFAYISCGTWSLVGVELDHPVLTEASREANFTNELGVDGTVRYLRNVMGLWLLQECIRTWAATGPAPDLESLLRQAADVPPFRAVIDPDTPGFLPPGDMPARIAATCTATGQQPPTTPAGTVRCIVDSLAVAYRRAVRDAASLSGLEIDVVHLVGGGARNTLLCQLTADACGLPVVAGPVEATALGNVLVQARALGAVVGTLADLRLLLRRTQRLVRYEPRGRDREWADAAARLDAVSVASR